MAFITVDTLSGDMKVSARWKGDNLTVHRLIVKRDDTGTVGLLPKGEERAWPWVVTHIHTKLSAGRFHSLESAIKCAKIADSIFNQTSKTDIEENKDLVSFWKQLVNNNCGIVC